MGASRSVILAMVYLIHYHNMTPDESIKLIKNKRECINPNTLFYDQLLEYYFLNYSNKKIEYT